jgi:septum formation protein
MRAQVWPKAVSGLFHLTSGYPWTMLFLASKSPRRRELLDRLGVEHGVLEVDVPEERQPGEAPADYVSRVAREKAGAGLLQVVAVPRARVLGADTEVVLGDKVYGKPADAADAAQMLRELAGRRHQVITAVWVLDAGREEHLLSETAVEFCPLSEPDIEDYLDSGEWQGKAGAYGIQGRAGAFVSRIEGSYTGVMGLPVHETWTLLRRFAGS